MDRGKENSGRRSKESVKGEKLRKSGIRSREINKGKSKGKKWEMEQGKEERGKKKVW